VPIVTVTDHEIGGLPNGSFLVALPKSLGGRGCRRMTRLMQMDLPRGSAGSYPALRKRTARQGHKSKCYTRHSNGGLHCRLLFMRVLPLIL
jgi:hypothetical protein